MIEVWHYDKWKQEGKSHYAFVSEDGVADLILFGWATSWDVSFAVFLCPWSTIYKDKKSAKENCPYSKKRGYAVLYKNLKTGKFTKS